MWHWEHRLEHKRNTKRQSPATTWYPCPSGRLCECHSIFRIPTIFCATRWVEDKKVSDRLLCIWLNIIKIINFWKSLPKRKQPSSKSFENVKTVVEDVLTPVKLSFFSYFASLFDPFSLKYQTQNPMLPHLYTDLADLFRLVLKLIIKDEVLENCQSGNQLTKIDFESGNVFKKNRELP